MEGINLELCWQHFDILKGINQAPKTSIKPGGSLNPRLVGTSDPVTRVGDDGEYHVCGCKCEFLIFGDSGDYVCTKSGLSFGVQFSNGSYDPRNFTDDIVTPTPKTRKRRTTQFAATHEEIYSACAGAVHKLLADTKRDAIDKQRYTKAIKSGIKIASAMLDPDGDKTKHVNCMELLFAVMTELERNGVNTIERKVTQNDLESLAFVLTDMFNTFIVPYCIKTKSKRPINTYYAVGMCYLLANPMMGNKLHLPVLCRWLPEEKSLKNIGINVSRVTIAKRYCLDAIKDYVQEFKKRKTTV